MNSIDKIIDKGIDSISLSFSGGGFRAAAYTLGCSSYLNELPYKDGVMLDKVRYISTVSGGAITAMGLFAFKRLGWDFDKIYNHILVNLSGDDLLRRAFKILETDSFWVRRPDKTRNLINAFAIAYDKYFFLGLNYDVLFSSFEAGKNKIVDELCVNSTELNNGMSFRFGTHGVLGNRFLRLDKDESKALPVVLRLKLGDVLASSSCFPAGFEPLIFPKDFSYAEGGSSLHWKELANLVISKNDYVEDFTCAELNQEMFGLMDGGIDDNQGVYSFLLADKRKGNQSDLYFTCDVSSNFSPSPYRSPKEKESFLSRYTLKSAFALVKRVLILATITVILSTLISLLFYPEILILWVTFLYATIGMSILLSLGFWLESKFDTVFGGAIVDYKANRRTKGTWQLVISSYRAEFLKFSIAEIISMLKTRTNSLLLLGNVVFLKKIRRSSYDLLYSNKRKRPHEQIGMTAIYLLAKKNHGMLQSELMREFQDCHVDGLGNLINFLQPSEKLRNHVDAAVEMETTLWFDHHHVKEKVLDSLLISGQATMCYNLLRICFRIPSNDSSWSPLKEQLISDWKRFNQEPDWLINKKDIRYKQ